MTDAYHTDLQPFLATRVVYPDLHCHLELRSFGTVKVFDAAAAKQRVLS